MVESHLLVEFRVALFILEKDGHLEQADPGETSICH
jgi:hypothetical protein